MTLLIPRTDFTDMVELWFDQGDLLGTFQRLHCDTHGDEWSFTDKSGTDNCLECVKDLAATEALSNENSPKLAGGDDARN